MNNWKNEIISTDKKCFELGLIWSKGNSLQQIANDIFDRIQNIEYDYLACVETRGIIFGAAVSTISGKEIRIFRKLNKINYTEKKYVREFKNWKKENDGIEIEKEQIKENDKIVVIDDIVDTAMTFQNINSIVKEANAEILAFICIKNISNKINIDGINIISLLE